MRTMRIVNVGVDSRGLVFMQATADLTTVETRQAEKLAATSTLPDQPIPSRIRGLVNGLSQKTLSRIASSEWNGAEIAVDGEDALSIHLAIQGEGATGVNAAGETVSYAGRLQATWRIAPSAKVTIRPESYVDDDNVDIELPAAAPKAA